MVMPNLALTTIRISFILVILSRVTCSPVDLADHYSKRRRGGSTSHRSARSVRSRHETPPWEETDQGYETDDDDDLDEDHDYSDYSNSDNEEDAETQRLLMSFGLTSFPRPHRRAAGETPSFMLDLYEKLQGSQDDRIDSELTFSEKDTPTANTVRSFREKGLPSTSKKSYDFDVTGILDRENIVSAELVLFKRHPKWRSASDPINPEHKRALIKVYHMYTIEKKGEIRRQSSLMDQRIIDVAYSGYLEFNVTRAFVHAARSLDLSTTNTSSVIRRTFRIKVRAPREDIQRTVRFIKFPADGRPEKQPLLVLYLNDNMIHRRDIRMPLGSRGVVASHTPSGWKLMPRHHPVIPDRRTGERSWNDSAVVSQKLTDTEEAADAVGNAEVAVESGSAAVRRKRRAENNRSTASSSRPARVRCQLHKYRVSFEKVGWTSWILAPPGYDGNFCEGFCPFPLDSHFNATNHATVQAILHTKKLRRPTGDRRRIPSPCCVPNSFNKISVLYMDNELNVILKEFDDMIATSCACH
ncbi:bone morphogenetic protein 2-like [Diadema antillarum]|uniref:bone morphogenetic protein 2-like n=1 Tax=Diadema antillarum TaxID=105358 RepID=UPI003A8B5278